MKNIIIFFTLLGVLPLYLGIIFNKQYFYLNNEKIELYCLLILSFLCGMHWQVLIFKNKNSIFIMSIPILIFIWGWSSQFINFFDTRLILITSFILSLFFDYVCNIFKPEKWYLKLRTIVTTLVIIALFL